MIIGIVIWLKNYNNDEQIVESKRLSNIQLSIISSIMILLCILFGYYMNNYTDMRHNASYLGIPPHETEKEEAPFLGLPP